MAQEITYVMCLCVLSGERERDDVCEREDRRGRVIRALSVRGLQRVKCCCS